MIIMRFIVRFFLFIILFTPSFTFSEDKSLSEDREIKTISLDSKDIHNKLKMGLALGYPWGITAGYRFSNFFELNGAVGTDFNHFTTGINALFTGFNLEIYDEIFPVSFGPAINCHFGYYDSSDKHDKYTKVDLLGVARIEYSFENHPINLFLEAGLGFQVIRFADDARCFGLGIRYIF